MKNQRTRATSQKKTQSSRAQTVHAPRAKVALDAKFWASFAARSWERSSVVVENVESPLLQMDEAEIFTLLVRFANRCRKRQDAEGFKFYIDGEKVHELQVLQLLPVARDRTLQGYHERMEAQFPDYCLVCDELLQVNEKKDLLIEFTKGLYREVGFPNRFAEMGLYLGNYRKTPFGVHVDGCGVFSFPIVGRKKFRIWPKAYDPKKPKKGSFVIKAQPGDMTYWPSTAWHIAESDGSFSATWSLGIWVDRAFKDDLARVLTDVIARALGASAERGVTRFQSLARKDGEVRELPELYLSALQQLKSLSSADLHEVFLNSWAAHLSKQGLKISKTSEHELKTGSSVRLKTLQMPILWVRSSKANALMLALNGQCVVAVKSKALLKLVEKLNGGGSIKVTASFPSCLRELAASGAYVIS